MSLLDTNVVSEFRKIRLKTVDRYVPNWAEKVPGSNNSIAPLIH
jgi:hypothetical protein